MQQTSPAREPILSADDRLASLLGMCGSNSDNEALAAARLADKLIRQHHDTWFDAVGADAAEPGAGDDRRFAACGGWRQAAWLGALHGGDIQSAWERRFCPTNSLRSTRTAFGKLELAGVAP
jgi:hypothetical protein